jgi:iron uptake system EfeUOB component EfeO/EfeM
MDNEKIQSLKIFVRKDQQFAKTSVSLDKNQSNQIFSQYSMKNKTIEALKQHLLSLFSKIATAKSLSETSTAELQQVLGEMTNQGIINQTTESVYRDTILSKHGAQPKTKVNFKLSVSLHDRSYPYNFTCMDYLQELSSKKHGSLISLDIPEQILKIYQLSQCIKLLNSEIENSFHLFGQFFK